VRKVLAERSPAVFNAIRRMDLDENGPGTVLGDTRGTRSVMLLTNGSMPTLSSFDDTRRPVIRQQAQIARQSPGRRRWREALGRSDWGSPASFSRCLRQSSVS
jgi:hypothetical protein